MTDEYAPLRAAIDATASEQAPVAFRITDGEGSYEYRDEMPDQRSIDWSARYGRKWEPLYASSPAHTSEARDAGQFYAACERACAELPAGWEIRVCLEKDAGTVELCSPDGFSEYMDVDADDRLTAEVNAAVDAAMRQAGGSES